MIHIETTGQGPDLALLHGWGLHGGVWDGLRGTLATSFRLHIVDLPGHGASPPIEPYSLAGLAHAVAETLPRRTHLCGWSLGGQVAMHIALDQPDRVDKLILIGATPCFRRRADWMHGMDDAMLDEFARSLEQDYAATLKRFLSLQARSGDDAREVIADLRAKLFERGVPALASLRGGLAILRDTDLRAAIPRLAGPVQVIHGERDTLVPVGAGEWLAGRVPGAEFNAVRGGAHAPFLSHRKQTLEWMGRFLHD